MTLEQIQNLLWWPPNSRTVGDLANFAAGGGQTIQIATAYRNHLTGDIVYNGRLDAIYRQANYHKWNDGRYFSFVLDSPKNNIHIEDIRLDDPIRPQAQFVTVEESVERDRIWECLNGVYSDYFISLRVMGYLIGCWRSEGAVEIGHDYISLAKSTFIPQAIHSYNEPIFAPLIVRTKPFVIATYPKTNVGNLDTIEFEYAVPDNVGFDEVLEYFNQHPRNFFLSQVRQINNRLKAMRADLQGVFNK